MGTVRVSVAVLILTTLAGLLSVRTAQAQWVNLARRAVGRVEQLSQSQGAGGVSYDSAAVILEAPADKVWDGVLRGLKNSNRGLTVTQEDQAGRVVQFTNGRQVAGIKVSPMGDNLTHLLVSSARNGDEPSAATLVMSSVQRVCSELKLHCAPAQQ